MAVLPSGISVSSVITFTVQKIVLWAGRQIVNLGLLRYRPLQSLLQVSGVCVVLPSLGSATGSFRWEVPVLAS